MRYLIWIVLVVLLQVGAFAQARDYFPSPRLRVEGQEVVGKFLRINYYVNYPGFVELHFFQEEWNDETGQMDKKRLAVRSKVTEPIDVEGTVDKINDYISLPVANLEPGRYRFEIHYKGVVRTGSYSHEGP